MFYQSFKKEKKTAPYYYGGQAVMEGVMMRGKTRFAMAVRRPDGEITIVEKPYNPAAKKHPILKWPLIRGVAAFVESLAVGMKMLTESAEIAGEGIIEEEPKTRFGKFFNNFFMQISVVLAVVLAVGLFMLLPAWIGSLSAPLLNGHTGFTGVIEGVVRICIFVLYVYLISLSKDIRRVFQYHGAEHKTLNCYEKGGALNAESIREYSRLHKRCGTSFLLVVMLISMVLFMFIRTSNVWLRFGFRILLLPVIAGLAYELSVKWAASRDNWLVRAVVFPGLCLQRLTTGEPDDAQIETAVAALNAVLDEKPENEPAPSAE